MNEHKFCMRRPRFLKTAAIVVLTLALICCYVFHAMPGTPRVKKRLLATIGAKDWPNDFSIRSLWGGSRPSGELYDLPIVHFSRSGERFLCLLESRDKRKYALVLDGKALVAPPGRHHLDCGFFGDTPWWVTYSEEDGHNSPHSITIGNDEILLPAGCSVTSFQGTYRAFLLSLRDIPTVDIKVFVVTGAKSYVIFNGRGLDHPYDSVDLLSIEISENGQVVAFTAELKGAPGRKVVVWDGENRTIYDADAPSVRNIALNHDGSKVAYVLVYDDYEVIMLNGESFGNKMHSCVMKLLFSPDGCTLGYLTLEGGNPHSQVSSEQCADVRIALEGNTIELGTVQLFPENRQSLEEGRWQERSIVWWWMSWYGFAPDGRLVYDLLDTKEERYVHVGNTCYDSVAVGWWDTIPLYSSSSPKFNGDGSKMAVHSSSRGDTGKQRIVVFDLTQPGKTGAIGDWFNLVGTGTATFSPCGKLVAYVGYSNDDQKCQLFVNHKPVGNRFVVMSQPSFSLDGTHVSYGAFDGVAFWHCTAKVK